jgi:hypothetical protein
MSNEKLHVFFIISLLLFDRMIVHVTIIVMQRKKPSVNSFLYLQENKRFISLGHFFLEVALLRK